MKLRIGDKVRFLNEVGEGVVSRIKDNTTVFVEMQDGFEIPYQVTQLVPIHTELIIDKNAENIELNPEANLTDAIYFVIEPDHEYTPLVSDFKIYLFNASSFNMSYTYAIRDGVYFQTIKHGEAGPYQKVLLKQVKMPFFNDYTSHKIEGILFKNTFYKPQAPISQTILITDHLLRKTQPVKHEEFKFPVFGFVLKDEFYLAERIEQTILPTDVEKLRNVKEFVTQQKKSKSARDYLKTLEKEVDLHIEELTDSVKGMSNYEMMALQLNKFEKELDEALSGKTKKLIVIHGVGNGRLRQEIHSVLKQTQGVTFQDAPYKDYGYGATQINIVG